MVPYQFRKPAPSDSQRQTMRMVDYIKANFAEVLGSDVHLLDQPDGLEILHVKYFGTRARAPRKVA
jgi:hypothetical protein